MGRLKRQVCISLFRCLAALLCVSQRAVHLSEEHHLDKGVLDTDNRALRFAFSKAQSGMKNKTDLEVPDVELVAFTVTHVLNLIMTKRSLRKAT